MKTKTILNIIDRVAESVEPVSQARLAAAIVYKNDVVAIGTNKNKTHPLQSKFAKHEQAIYLHAEIDAIKNALRHLTHKELAKSTLYISRMRFDASETKPVSTNLKRGLAMPCSGCMRAIKSFGIKNVCFTTDDQEFAWL
jgi:tRNA(Arg) A34 adenosine deaminase TadA